MYTRQSIRRRAARVALALTALCLLTPPFVRARGAQPAAPAFEVASIRPNAATTGPRNWKFHPGGRFTATNLPLRALIRLAYGFDTIRLPAQMTGGPDWIDSQRFDIEAKAAEPVGAGPDGIPRPLLAMLRTLLEERFKVRAHIEIRELPIYELVVAKPGRLGPELKPSTVDCNALEPAPAGGEPRSPCGVRSGGAGRIEARGVTMEQVAGGLALFPAIGRIVRDHTELTGA